MKNATPLLSRRGLLIGAGIAAAAIAARPRLTQAAVTEADRLIETLTGGVTPQAGKVSIKLPQIAENGNTVPFTVSVDSPMTDKDFVKAVHVVAEGNPAPGVASFNFTPAAGKAEVAMRMRLAKTQNVRAIAVMSDGSVYQAEQEVKVTIGGCGG